MRFEKIVAFLEMYKGLINLLDNYSNDLYIIDITVKYDSLCLTIKNDPYNYVSNGKINYIISEKFRKEEIHLIINTIKNMFIEERKIHKPFLDFKRGESIIENSKFHLITHFDINKIEEINDAMYFQDLAVEKYENDNFGLIKR